MSRIGKKPVEIPSGVKVALGQGEVKVEGPKGKLTWKVHPAIDVKVDGAQVVVSRKGDTRLDRALHGLVRATINNMVTGVVKPYEKTLDINGVGYNVKLAGREMSLTVGFSHIVKVQVPDGISVTCPSQTRIVVQGPDKHLVGQFAANVRFVRPVEPYNLKGIKYADEVVKRKQGKTFVSGG
ncbi:MAG: 50S ribosomal protein L6 [Candidatus Brocadiae bacterium]|nr:50S ribosomal protein L6 [Candidatus Brocadiia bacterium]